jgi:hypothetical protein
VVILSDLFMVDWQVTATTIYCESVDDEVTLIIKSDGSLTCSGRQRFEKPGKEADKVLKQKSKITGKQLKCTGDSCASLKQYRDKMLGEK